MLSIASMLLAFAALTSTVNAPIAMTPTGKWVVNYADTFCFASRSYRSGDDTINLTIRSVIWSNYGQLLLIKKDQGGYGYGDGSIQFNSGGVAIPQRFTSDVNGDTGRRVFRMLLSSGTFEGLKGASVVSVTTDVLPMAFSTPGIDKAFAALKACDDDLLRKWGIDPQESNHLSRTAIPVNPVKPTPYPEDARRLEIQGRAVVLTSVSTTGITSDCHIIMNSGFSSLDDATCATALKTRYRPAIDTLGNETASHVILPILWTLPN